MEKALTLKAGGLIISSSCGLGPVPSQVRPQFPLASDGESWLTCCPGAPLLLLMTFWDSGTKPLQSFS